MNTSESFQHNLNTEFNDLEHLRKKVLFKICVIYGLCIALCMFTFSFLIIKINNIVKNDEDYIKIILASSGLLLVFIITFLYIVNQKTTRIYLFNGEYAKEFKRKIFSKAIPMKFEGLKYDSENGISKTEFIESGFPMFQNVARYYTSGRITGEINKTPIVFSEVLAEENQKTTNEDGLGSSDYVVLFQGMFFIVDLKKNIRQNTLVYPDILKYFKSAIFINENQNYDRIKLEDTEFEKFFEVYGTDQVESRYILSPALMARMVDFRKHTKNYLQISFKDSKAYIGIFLQGKNLSTPPIFSSVSDPKNLENYFKYIQLTMDIIKELNLNSKLD